MLRHIAGASAQDIGSGVNMVITIAFISIGAVLYIMKKQRREEEQRRAKWKERQDAAATSIAGNVSAMPVQPDDPVGKPWYVARDGKEFGPYSWGNLCSMAAQRQVVASDYILPPGAAEWVQATALKWPGPGLAE